MSSDTTYQEYLTWLTSSTSQALAFRNIVKSAYFGMIVAFSQIQNPTPTPGNPFSVSSQLVETQLTYLANSLGLSPTTKQEVGAVGEEVFSITMPVFNTANFSPATFYEFWNTPQRTTPWSQAVVAYLNGNAVGVVISTPDVNTSDSSSTGSTRLNQINAYATYIMIRLFSSIQYNTSISRTSFTPDLTNTVNNQPAVRNIKNFLQNSNQTEDNLQGCGNFSFSSTGGINPSSNNDGFIDKLCGYYYSNYLSLASNKLTLEQINNNYRNNIAQNPTLLAYCGCFAPIVSIPGETTAGYGVSGNSPCDPLCTNPNSFSLYQTTINNNNTIINPLPAQCQANFCIIDSANINSLNSNGTVNFNQACTGCGYQKDGCICFVDVSSKDLINKIGFGKTGMTSQQNFNQGCAKNSVCFKKTNGITEVVNCNNINTPATGSLFSDVSNGQTKITTPAYITDFFWFVVSIIFFLVVMFMYQISIYY